MPSYLAPSFNSTKYFYFGVFAFTAVLTWILRDYAASSLSHIGPMRSCLTVQDADLRVWPSSDF